jgi:hypothetical protein
MHTKPYLDYLCKKYGALCRLLANEPGRERMVICGGARA